MIENLKFLFKMKFEVLEWFYFHHFALNHQQISEILQTWTSSSLRIGIFRMWCFNFKSFDNGADINFLRI